MQGAILRLKELTMRWIVSSSKDNIYKHIDFHSNIPWLGNIENGCKKISLLSGKFTQDVFITQPKACVHSKHPNSMCKLPRAFYGLKQGIL